jgi:hypothetical protein
MNRSLPIVSARGISCLRDSQETATMRRRARLSLFDLKGIVQEHGYNNNNNIIIKSRNKTNNKNG